MQTSQSSNMQGYTDLSAEPRARKDLQEMDDDEFDKV